MDVLEINNGIVSVTKEGMLIKEIKELIKLDTDKNKKFFNKTISYVFFAYSKKSPFWDILPAERKLVASNEIFSNTTEWQALEKNQLVADFIAKYLTMQLSAKERLLEGVNKKIEEYLQFMQDTQINQKNHAEIALQIKNSNELLKLRDTIEKQVLEQKSSRDVGGGSKKLFEDEST
jgi:hypothetical protein